MALASFVQSSFLGGEFSQAIQGRYDRQEYRTGLNRCLNGLPLETGMWVRRPGFNDAGTTRGGQPGRVMRFDFQQAQPYMMEFTNSHLRFRTGIFFVIDTTSNITSISTANPAVLQTPTDPGWSTGDRIFFGGLGGVAPLLQNREFLIARNDATHYALSDGLSGQPIDGSTLAWLAVGGSSAQRILDISTQYNAGAWANLRIVQTETTALFLCPNIAPFGISVIQQPTASTLAMFSILLAANFTDGPYLDPVTSGTTLTAGGTGTGSVTFNASDTMFQDAAHGGPGFSTDDVGRLIRIFCEPAAFNFATTYSAGAAVKYQNTYYAKLTNAAPPAGGGGPSNAAPDIDTTNWKLKTDGAKWVWGQITVVNSSTQVVVTILDVHFADGSSGATFGISAGVLYSGVAFARWRLGAYGGHQKIYPTCGTYSDGRIFLGGAVPNRFDACMSNGITAGTASAGVGLDFTPTGPDGSVATNNAISYTLNSKGTNLILWMHENLQGISMGTKAGEWLAIAPTAGPMAPANISARKVTSIGGANVEPVEAEHTLLFVQKGQRKIMEYFADVFSGKFTGPHITFTWKHLTVAGIQEIAYQQELAPIAWARTTNNGLLGCTYKRDTLMTSQGPTIAGGHEHGHGGGRGFVSIATGPALGGNTDTLTAVTFDPNGIYHVEVLGNIIDEGFTLAQASYLDAAITASSVSQIASSSPNFPFGGLQINGLWNLNGKTVQAWIGGLDVGVQEDGTFKSYTVSNGSIQIPYGDGLSWGSGKGLFTQAFVSGIPLSQIVVGFFYNSDGQLVRPNSPQDSGARSGPGFAKLKRAHYGGWQLEGTQGLLVGYSFGALRAAELKSDGVNRNTIIEQFTGITRENIGEPDSFNGAMLCWRANRGGIANVAACGAMDDTKDV